MLISLSNRLSTTRDGNNDGVVFKCNSVRSMLVVLSSVNEYHNFLSVYGIFFITGIFMTSPIILHISFITEF